eukprot:9476934-Lingulodinium_polyedra.AAC.1
MGKTKRRKLCLVLSLRNGEPRLEFLHGPPAARMLHSTGCEVHHGPRAHGGHPDFWLCGCSML